MSAKTVNAEIENTSRTRSWGARAAMSGSPGASGGPAAAAPATSTPATTAPATAALADRVVRLRPRPDPGGVGEHLPIAVGFGSDLLATPRTLWVVPGVPAEAVALPTQLDPGHELLEGPELSEGAWLLDGLELSAGGRLTPLRLSGPVSTPAVGRRDWADDSRAASVRRLADQPVPLRLTARGRAALLVLAGMVGALVVVFAWFGAAASPTHASKAVPAQVVVHDGDTLWSIAGRVAPGRDPRVVVDQLRQLNHLGSPSLVPGQVLRTR